MRPTYRVVAVGSKNSGEGNRPGFFAPPDVKLFLGVRAASGGERGRSEVVQRLQATNTVEVEGEAGYRRGRW